MRLIWTAETAGLHYEERFVSEGVHSPEADKKKLHKKVSSGSREMWEGVSAYR
jgi:hypothetical protein